MRRSLAALAFAGALLSFMPANAGDGRVRVAQVARDVTDAVRKQRNQRRAIDPERRGQITHRSKQ